LYFLVTVIPFPLEAVAPADLLKDYRDGLVFVEGTTGQGSGFVVNYRGQKYLFTNAHVMAGVRSPQFKLLDRSPVKVGAAVAAVAHDILALSIVEGGTAIPSVESVDKEASIGDPVVVLGNAEGAGVVNLLQGTIVGIGPNLVEVDAPFVPGNSGSPIIHLPTGKVLGIATYMMVKRIGPREERVRRFGYRLDSVQQWQTVDWRRFYAEADAVEKIEKTTAEFATLLEDFSKNGRPTRSYNSPGIRNAVDAFSGAIKSGTGKSDAEQIAERLLSALKLASSRDVREAKAMIGYDFFRRQLETEARDRDEITRVFDQALKRQKR
jgi:hypothetical protein